MMVKIIMIKKLSLINVSCNLMRIIQAIKANRRREKDKLLSHKEDNFDSSILQPVKNEISRHQKEKKDNEISIAEPSYYMAQSEETDRMITIKAVHSNNASLKIYQQISMTQEKIFLIS